MINPFLDFSDGTKVICSDPINIDGRMCVRVIFERWSAERNDYDRMECLLPDGEMTGVKGFTPEEVRYHHGKMIKMQDNILEWSSEMEKSNMVTFKLMEIDGNIAIYHYWVENNEQEKPNDYGVLAFDKVTLNSEIRNLAPDDSWNTISIEERLELREWENEQRKEQGKPPLTEEEWPVPKRPLKVAFSGQMAYVEIKREFKNKGALPEDGRNYWY
ncbi:MAG: hypothetical protein II089_02200 [Selenomonas sp.]|nr:hypothetical protein [Selenomonas sp.]MBQ1613444.1 hypothetical protein [Selenomonas sp.]MBQ2086898.1 hypothetical protein [Selenomonas sp.]